MLCCLYFYRLSKILLETRLYKLMNDNLTDKYSITLKNASSFS